MVYWTSTDGTICAAESKNADAIEAEDEEFAASFRVNTIVGRNLFHFFAGLEVSHLYQQLALRVAATGRAISFEYRCDAPHVRRDMQMKLSLDAELIRYESVTLRETVRQLAIPKESPEADTFVAICSFCKNYRFPVSSDAWKQLEQLPAERDLPEAFRFTHSICETCYAKALGD